MAIFKIEELRNMSPDELSGELDNLRDELIRERGTVATGGAPENPGQIRELRRAIARIKTVQKERVK